MWNKTKSLLKRFRAARDGNMAIIGAVLGVPVMIGAIGLSVDYSMGTNNRTSMQNALDSAIWQTAQLDPEMTQAAKQVELQKFYAANGGLGTAIIDSMSPSSTHVVLAASASYDMKTTAMGIAGVKNVRIVTKSSAQLPYKLSSATFAVTKQTGWWAKTIRLYGRKEGETQYKQLMRLVYGGKRVGSSSYNANYKYVTNQTTGVESLVSGSTVTVDLVDIESLFMSMSIDASLASIREAVFNSSTSSYILNYPAVIESDDPLYVGRMHITKGSTIIQNANTDIYARLGCGESEKHSWEDGGSIVRQRVGNTLYYNLLEGTYSSSEVPNGTVAQKAGASDFGYTITGRCSYVTGGAYMTQ